MASNTACKDIAGSAFLETCFNFGSTSHQAPLFLFFDACKEQDIQILRKSSLAFLSIPTVGVAKLTFRILAYLQFGEGLEQSSLSEHGEDGVLRVVDQFFKIALHIGTHEAAMGNSSSGRPDFCTGYDGAVDVPQGDLCYWSCETHATGLAHLGPQEFPLDKRHEELADEAGIRPEALRQLGGGEMGNAVPVRQSQAEHNLKRCRKSNVDQR
jgi:hypothetical protein